MEYNAAIQMSRPGYPSPVAIADSSQFPRTRPQDDRAGGIESAMWQMSLRSSEIAEAGPYPERPGEQDCAYYMRTGLCRFGMTCRFNHPPNRKLAVAAARMKGGYPERIGQPECQRENLDELLSNNDGGVMQGVADCQTRLEPLKMTKQSWLPHYVSVSFRVKSEILSWSSTHEASDLVNHVKGVSFCSSATMRCFDGIMSMFICLKYYLKTGTCKFGATCKFHHPRDKAGVAGRVLLNVLGYPLRPNEKECAYYLRTGQCKYGGTCKFHHPQPISLRGSAIYSPIHSPTTPGQQSYPSGLTNWPLSRAPFVASPRWQGPASYAQLILPQGVVPVPGWNTYTGQLSSMSSSDGQQQNLGTGQYYGTSRQSDTTNAGGQGTFSPYRSSSIPMGLFALQKENIFPERPDQPECQFYMKTGDCKFGAVCRFHHPRERLIPAPNCVLSPMGLPLRPGEPLCTFYSHYGICKFGPTCKFDHPMSAVAFSLPTSSSDVPVVHRLLGTSSGTPVLPLTSEVSGEVSSGKSRRLPLSDTRQMSSGEESIENEGTHTA